MNGILLSDAIRLGAMLGPQATNGYMFQARMGGEMATCALGAAAIIVGIKCDSLEPYRELCRIFPGCDLANEEKGIVHLNDDLRMTREQIADWLVESGNDCESITVAPAQEIATALVSAHMVAK